MSEIEWAVADAIKAAHAERQGAGWKHYARAAFRAIEEAGYVIRSATEIERLEARVRELEVALRLQRNCIREGPVPDAELRAATKAMNAALEPR